EIEEALIASAGVMQSVVVVHEDERGQHLVAYVTARDGASVSERELIAELDDRLPGYMVPETVVVLDAMPLNASGKIDRKALPEPVIDPGESRYVAPRTATEEVVAGIIADVLGADRVSVEESFFDLGGNSLSATRVAARVGEALGVEIGMRDLFDAPTVAELAGFAEHADGAGAARPRLARADPPEQLLLSMAQQRMWLLNRFDPASPAYNVPLTVRFSGALDVDALSAALHDVIARQETLRTVFPGADGEAEQVILPAERAAVDLTPVDTDE